MIWELPGDEPDRTGAEIGRVPDSGLVALVDIRRWQEVGGRAHPLIRTGGCLQLGDRAFHAEEGVLPRLRKLARVSRDAGLDARERGEHDQHKDDKGQKDDGKHEREALLLPGQDVPWSLLHSVFPLISTRRV